VSHQLPTEASYPILNLPLLLIVCIDELLDRYLVILVDIDLPVYIECELRVDLAIGLLDQKPLHLLDREQPVLVRVYLVEFLLQLAHDPLVLPLPRQGALEYRLLVSLFEHHAVRQVVLGV
jgi:hypothetical protein